MDEKKLNEKNRGYLKLAYEVQRIARPYQKEGKYSLTEIYLNFVVIEIPICINTFRKMMKEDVSGFPEMAKNYQQKAKSQYLVFLQNQSRKRVKKSKKNNQRPQKSSGIAD